jgi:GNAT superfamily N-acetyltransferase
MEAVRRATGDDLTDLLALYDALRVELAGYRGRWYDLDAWPEPVDEIFGTLVEDPDALVLVGTIDDVAIGYLAATVVTPLPQAAAEPLGRVHDLFVEPDAREVGVGEALLSAAIEWFAGRGVVHADIRVLPGHRAAKNFCEENGFVARALIMHARWDDAAVPDGDASFR